MAIVKASLGEIEPIHFVDLGCSGELDEKWQPLVPLLAYVGFDPNADECSRLNSQPHSFRSATYYPYAVSGQSGMATMHLTESIYCYSLLRPDSEWLSRFSYAGLFSDRGAAEVPCVTLADLASREGLVADILKLDTQGMELQILEEAGSMLDDVLCIEAETGFTSNYHGETTFSQIDLFLREHSFLMFDMQMHRVGRSNPLGDAGLQQPLWCESLWMRDFVGEGRIPTPAQARKALVISRSLELYDYGFELAVFCRENGVLDKDEGEMYCRISYWQNPIDFLTNLISSTVRYLPHALLCRLWRSVRRRIEAADV